MKYLTQPCPRCNSKTLRPPEKRGNKTTCLCDTCKKHMGYRVIPHVDGTAGYELYFVGGKAAEKKVARSHRLPQDLAELSTESIIHYIRKGMECDTMQYKH